MFDLISGKARHPFHDRTVAPQLVSVAVHGLVLSAVLLLPLLVVTEQLPVVPTMMAFVAAPVAPPSPPPPPPPKKPARAPAAKAAAPTASTPDAAPIAAPLEIAPEPAAFRGDESFGVEGGVEGGVVGGSLGGLVGGLVDAPALPPPPPPPPPAPRAPVRVGGQLSAPELVHRVEPVYPPIAVVAKVTGTVILEAVVASDGSVQSVKVLRPVRFLDSAAIAAVRQWRYQPLMLNGVPTPFVLTVILTFSEV
jgi:protein TonB